MVVMHIMLACINSHSHQTEELLCAHQRATQDFDCRHMLVGSTHCDSRPSNALDLNEPSHDNQSCWLHWSFVSALQIVKIECAWKGQPPFPKQDFNYHHKLVGPTRADIKPLNIVQPEGPSFTVSPSLPALPLSVMLHHSSLPYHSGPSLMLHACDSNARVCHCMCLRQDNTRSLWAC